MPNEDPGDCEIHSQKKPRDIESLDQAFVHLCGALWELGLLFLWIHYIFSIEVPSYQMHLIYDKLTKKKPKQSGMGGSKAE